MTNTYLFYDIETTGLNKCFDQVLQFAAIRTDAELNEISRHEYRIKLNPDVVPSPMAMITTHIDLNMMAQGDAEYEVILKIHALLNAPGTISVGYNTLGFDDEFLRFSFYRNLLPPYTHQFANGCGRMDIYPITLLYYLFNHDTLTWPQVNDKVSLKLENLNKANQLATGQAHDAMVDVEATLNLAKRLIQSRKMWDYAVGYFNKRTDIERCDQLPIAIETAHYLYREGLLIQSKLGMKQNCIAPVISLGQHTHYKNQTIWIRLDDEALLTLKPEQAEDIFVIRKKMGEQDIILPPQPRYLVHLIPERQQLAQQVRQHLIDHPALLDALKNYHLNYTYPEVPNIDIDAALYTQPFPTSTIERLCRKFHQANPTEKHVIAKQLPTGKREQALRILARHYPEVRSEKERLEFKTHCQAACVDFRGLPRRNLDTAFEELAENKPDTITLEQQRVLDTFLSQRPVII